MANRVSLKTVLFTDIEGSSRLWEAEPARMSAAMSAHDRLMRDAIRSHKGYFVRDFGDGISAFFDDPLDALRASVAIQACFANPAATAGIAFGIRCGIHCGAVERRGADYCGNAVNRASRIMATARGGQVLVSRAVVDLLSHVAAHDFAFQPLGPVALRGMTESEQLFELAHPMLVPRGLAIGRATQALQLRRHASGFVGRAAELREVEALVRASRLVTVTGLGGIGKTRLAIEVARRMAHDFRDGVWFADLATVSEPELVASAVAKGIGLPDTGAELAEPELREHLRHRQFLLILDNCEHLLEASASLAASLLDAAHGGSILATTREALGVQGEHVYALPPMGLESDSVQLFVECMAAAQASKPRHGDQLDVVRRLCVKLDGIPLAIEIAAAHVATLGLSTTARRLDDRFELLTNRNREAPARHQTLVATIGWSYELLGDTERAVFTRLSLFEAGCTLEAAEFVCQDDRFGAAAVGDALANLVRKSLVIVDQAGDRYRMVPTVRDYARGRFLESATAESATVERYVEFFQGLAQEADKAVRVRDHEAQWLIRLDLEHENLVHAIRRAIESLGQPDSALALCCALGYFWSVRGHWRLGRELCRLAIAKDAAGSSPLTARCVLTEGVMAFNLGLIADASALYRDALEKARACGDRMTEAGALNNLASVALERGEAADASGMLAQAALINNELGNHSWESINLGNLERSLIAEGKVDAALEPLKRAIELSRQHGNRSMEAAMLSRLAQWALARSELGTAEQLGRKALAIYEELGAPANEVEQVALLAETSLAAGQLDSARTLFAEGLRRADALGYRLGMSRCLNGLLALAGTCEEYDRVAVLVGAADAMGMESAPVPGSPAVPERGRLWSHCHASLGDSRCELAYSYGRSMSTPMVMSWISDWLQKPFSRGSQPCSTISTSKTTAP